VDPQRLKRLPLFALLGDDAVAQIAVAAEEVEVDEGHALIREGRPSYEFFVIEEGTAEVTHAGEHLAELGPGDFFGEIGLLETGRRTATVTARSPMKLVTIHGPRFRQLAREMPEFPTRVRTAIRHRLARE
jgi:CRP-like cAMP-binding protein